MALPSVGTRGFVPGGGGDRTCCKPIEPPPSMCGTCTITAGPFTRPVHIEDTVLTLRLSRSRRPAEPAACPAPSVLHLHTTPTQTARAHIPAPFHPNPPPTWCHNSTISALFNAGDKTDTSSTNMTRF